MKLRQKIQRSVEIPVKSPGIKCEEEKISRFSFVWLVYSSNSPCGLTGYVTLIIPGE